MKYYVVDTTLNSQSHNQVIKFNSYQELVLYLEGLSLRAFGKSRKQRMILLEEVGHGYDDDRSVNFVRSMAETFTMGVVRNNQLVRCDVVAAEFFQKEEYGS